MGSQGRGFSKFFIYDFCCRVGGCEACQRLPRAGGIICEKVSAQTEPPGPVSFNLYALAMFSAVRATYPYAKQTQSVCGAKTLHFRHRRSAVVVQTPRCCDTSRPRCDGICGCRKEKTCNKKSQSRANQIQMVRFGPVFVHNRCHGLWEASGLPPSLQNAFQFKKSKVFRFTAGGLVDRSAAKSP